MTVIRGKVREWIPLLEDVAADYGDFEAVLLMPPFQGTGRGLEEHGIRTIEIDHDVCAGAIR